MYFRNNINHKTDLNYNMFGSERPWDNKGDAKGENLRQRWLKIHICACCCNKDIKMAVAIIFMPNMIFGKWTIVTD